MESSTSTPTPLVQRMEYLHQLAWNHLHQLIWHPLHQLMEPSTSTPTPPVLSREPITPTPPPMELQLLQRGSNHTNVPLPKLQSHSPRFSPTFRPSAPQTCGTPSLKTSRAQRPRFVQAPQGPRALLALLSPARTPKSLCLDSFKSPPF